MNGPRIMDKGLRTFCGSQVGAPCGKKTYPDIGISKMNSVQSLEKAKSRHIKENLNV